MHEGPFCPPAGCVTLVVGETKLGMVLQAPRVPEPWLVSAAGTGTSQGTQTHQLTSNKQGKSGLYRVIKNLAAEYRGAEHPLITLSITL